MISIRDANESDVPAIVRLVNTAFLVEQFFIERDRTNPEMVRSLMEKGNFCWPKTARRLPGAFMWNCAASAAIWECCRSNPRVRRWAWAAGSSPPRRIIFGNRDADSAIC